MHWSTRSLQLAAVELELVETIHFSTIAQMLRRAELKPHRSRSWKSPRWTEKGVEQAAQILRLYEQVDSLAEAGEVLLCIDEKPQMQVLQRRAPTKPMKRGLIERQEFEYNRRGTVNLLVALDVLDGQMWSCPLPRNDTDSFVAALGRLLHNYDSAKRVHLILDNGPSHVSTHTGLLLHSLAPRVQAHFTPPRSSWLNQAELLLRAFSARYLHRGNWPNPEALQQHLEIATEEYNACFAHPFRWSWTPQRFGEWLKEPGRTIHFTTCTTVH